MAIASAQDVQDRWVSELSDDETRLVNARLEDVERMIRKRIPDLDAKVSDGDIDVDDVKQVEADAVLRLLRNPEGYLQENDGQYSYMLARDLASGKVEILPEEWELLGIRRTQMFQLVPTFAMPS